MAGVLSAGGQPGDFRILVVEDEESYREALYIGFTKEGYQVELAADGAAGLRSFMADPPDLVLLDLMLPGVDGIEICRRIRSVSNVPVIMVTALDTEVDVVLGLELGAVDYVTKPFRMRELLARVKAVLRRISPPDWASPPAESRAPAVADEVVAGPVTMNFTRREVLHDGKVVNLSRREFELLALLLSPPGQLRTRDELIDRLWSGQNLTDTRTLDTHIRRLRLKLEDDPADPEYLVTVRGVGFRFDAEGRNRGPMSPPGLRQD